MTERPSSFLDMPSPITAWRTRRWINSPRPRRLLPITPTFSFSSPGSCHNWAARSRCRIGGEGVAAQSQLPVLVQSGISLRVFLRSPVRQVGEVLETGHRPVCHGLCVSGGGKRHDGRHGGGESRLRHRWFASIPTWSVEKYLSDGGGYPDDVAMLFVEGRTGRPGSLRASQRTNCRHCPNLSASSPATKNGRGKPPARRRSIQGSGN